MVPLAFAVNGRMVSAVNYREVFGSDLGEIETEGSPEHTFVRLARDLRPRALAMAKTRGFTFYNFCSAVDWPDDGRFDVIDQVYDWVNHSRITLRYSIPRDEPVIDSGVGIYAGCNWYERETGELFGIVFRGHPNPTRLFLPDWQSGYPLRKDFVLRARVEKPWPGEFFQG